MKKCGIASFQPMGHVYHIAKIFIMMWAHKKIMSLDFKWLHTHNAYEKNLVQYFPIYSIKFNSIGDGLNTYTNE